MYIPARCLLLMGEGDGWMGEMRAHSGGNAVGVLIEGGDAMRYAYVFVGGRIYC